MPHAAYNECTTDLEYGQKSGGRKSRRDSHSNNNDPSEITECSRSGSTGSRKSMKKHLSKAFKYVFGGSRSSSSKGEEAHMIQYVDVHKSGGTFDNSSVATPTPTSSFPRSPSNLTKKWGQLKDQMGTHDLSAIARNARPVLSNAIDQVDPEQRAEMIEEEQNKIREMMEFNLKHCFLAMLIYVAASVGCFSYWLEDWTIIDSVYFAIVTFTTIGYGDVVPNTLMARIFTCFWSLSGVACLGIALGVLGSRLVDVAEQDRKEKRKKHHEEVFDMFNNDNVPSQDRPGDGASISHWSDIESVFVDDLVDEEESECHSCFCSPKTQRISWLFAFVGAILYFLSVTEGWNSWSTIYYGLITASTVGYGDLSPQTQNGRLLAICFIPIAVGVMGSFLDLVANSIIQKRHLRAQEKLKDKKLTLRDLEVMDGDGDGTVTRAEFLEFMLVAMNQVDQETLDYLKDRFERLDNDKSGTLDKGDLINVARFNLRREQSMKRTRRRL